MAVRIKDVSELAGVSTATVSHVINGTRYVSDSTKKIVLEAMEKLNYQPNQAARSLRSQKSNTVGVIIPDISSFYFSGVAEGIEYGLRKNGYHMILSNSHESISDEQEMVKIYNSHILDGLIIIPAPGDHSYLSQLISPTYPVVFVVRKPIGFKRDCVVLDNKKSTFEATELLLSKGHERIGMILGSEHLSTTKERIEGYKQAIAKKGIPFDQSIIKTGDFKIDSGYKITGELVNQHHATGLFLASDTLAIGAELFLKEHEIKVPDSVALISCNDFKWTQIATPPLTVVKQPSTELGVKAAEVLLNRINNPDKKNKYRDYRFATSIVERESC